MTRNRVMASHTIRSKQTGSVKYEVYAGVLPEEMLLLLVEQALTLRVREIPLTLERWVGPDENIQGAMLVGRAEHMEATWRS